MKYSFEQIKAYLQELLEKYCEPELSIFIDGKEYMIILYHGYCSFQKCGDSIELEFESLDELYSAKLFNDIVLKNHWNRITKVECYDFEYLNLPTVLL